ncbi:MULTISPECIES: hypothetical protein [unclassified Streptomyces]|uniref:hypothetical protein n=1 Tax=unclassified Streptomyces TaxID=2593676 RepID=UPI001F51B56C|nr:hypothetical protein [Streptomyces sp. TSRI0107]
MSGGMEEWGHGARGRIVTWPAPDAYVLVEGVLLRMLPDTPGLPPGTEVEVRHDPARGGLVAHATADPGDENGTGRA